MKLKYLLILFSILILPTYVKADHIYNLNMDIYVEENGNAKVTETWDVKADNGTEWYKQYIDLENTTISDFYVYMDNNQLTKKDIWNVDETLEEKSGYYGINNITKPSTGIELCFGKVDMNRHTFTLKYNINNFIYNTSDKQIIYFTMFPRATADNFNVNVRSYYQFPDTLDVWGYGYDGYAYVKDGKIIMKNKESLRNEYVVLLASFPSNTFKTNNSSPKFTTFKSVLSMAEEGAKQYKDDSLKTTGINFIYIILVLIGSPIIIFVLIILISFIYGKIKAKKEKTEKHLYNNDNSNNNYSNIPLFRDIPCNKDIFYANTLLYLNGENYEKGNIIGAILLKWVKENKITFIKNDQNSFKEKNGNIRFYNNIRFDNVLEEVLYKMMKIASKDDVLEAKEFKKYCKDQCVAFSDLLDTFNQNMIKDLLNKNIITKANNSSLNEMYILSDKALQDSTQLIGLKRFLDEFSKIDTREVLEVKLWDEYLMFAYLFGIADKVSEQFHNLYPAEIPTFDYDVAVFISDLILESFKNMSSYRSIAIATDKFGTSIGKIIESTTDDARSYSAGGGGRSSRGGGSGSIGGGGRGSMGGR